MVKIYVMESCPDCAQAKEIYRNNPNYQIIDIGKQAKDLKEFLVLRDTHPGFERVRQKGTIGIPCFLKEDGSVVISLKRYDPSIVKEEEPAYLEGIACNIDGSGC